MSSEGDGSGFTIGLLLGAAVGVAVGFLYAPKPGRETRQMLKEKAEEARSRAKDVSEKAKETAAEARKRVEDRLNPDEEKS